MVDQGPSQLGAGVSSSAQPPESAPVAAVPPVRAAESWPAVAAASCTEPRQTLRHCHRSSYMYSSLTSHPGACVEKQDYPKFSPPAMAFPEPKPLVRCDSCKSTGTDSVPSSPTVHTLMELNQHGLEQLSEASQMQLRWDRAMCDELKLPEGYLKASVLLIKWRDEEDQFKNTNEEVQALQAVFKESFGYDTKVVDLSGKCTCEQAHCRCTPQDRFNRHVSRFMKHCDGSNNLTIIYYTGHGTYVHPTSEDVGYLKLHAFNNAEHPSLRWDYAENEFIKSAKGDVLTIMDACFAGNVRAKVERLYGRTYEYLGACGLERTTASPGEHSFTTALVASLKELRARTNTGTFTTADLMRAVEERSTRQNNPPILISRAEINDRHILLSPHWQTRPDQANYFTESYIPAYLTLRIELTQERLSPEEVEDLARKVSAAVRDSKVQTRRVDWLRLSSREKANWKNIAKLFHGASAFRNTSRPALDTVPENVEPDVLIDEPGILARFYYVDPWKHLHTGTITLLQPWPRIIGMGLAIAVLTSLYFHRGGVNPHTSSSLVKSLRSNIGAFFRGAG